MENATDATATVDEIARVLVGTVSRTVEQQAALIARLTAPEPSPVAQTIAQSLAQALPALVPVVMQLADKTLRREVPRDLGPAERLAIRDFEEQHAQLVSDFNAKRGRARAHDEAVAAGRAPMVTPASSTSSASEPANGKAA